MIRSMSRRQLTGDAAIAAVLLLARSVLGYDTFVVFWVAVGMAVALLVRRFSPAIALGLAWCTVTVQLASALPPDLANVAILPVLYSTGAYGPRIVRWLGLASVPVGAAVATVYMLILQSGGLDNLASLVLEVRTGEAFQSGAPGVIGFTSALTLFGLSWALGLLALTWGKSRASTAALLAAEAEQAAAVREVAVEQERTRIARDMHDVVAHSLAVVIAQADGGRYARATNPEAADDAFRTIATTAREALADVRALLRQLRSNETAGPQPTMDDLARLVDQFRRSGLTIEHTETGQPVRLGSGQQLAIYRIVQESLTNVLRHGDSSEPVAVRFAWAHSSLKLTVSSGLRSPRTSVSGPTGHGLDGMRERAILAGGTCDAGVTGDRFVVSVSLPVVTGESTSA